MSEKATCPDCGTDTKWISVVAPDNGELIKRFQALCDGCQADRAFENAFAGTDY